MKILLVNNLYPPHVRGGAEQVVVATACGLRDAGHEVVVLTAAPYRGISSLWPRGTLEDGIRVLRFYPLNLFFYLDDFKHGALTRLLWHVWNLVNLHSALVFWDVLAITKPHVVHFHNINGLGYLLPLIATIARSGATKQSLTLHGLQYAIPDGIMTVGHEYDFRVAGFAVRWYAWVVSVLMRPIATIISPSQYLLDFYTARGFFHDRTTHVLRNPLPTSPTTIARSGATKQSLYAEEIAMLPSVARDGTTVRLLYVGQIEDHKGIFFLLDTIFHDREIRSQGTRLVVVGGGARLPELKRRGERHQEIRVVGQVSHEELGQYFENADFLIFPSLYYENMPMVIAEAFAHGLPVIASRIGGVPELVEDEKTGFLFAPGDAESLREAIARALQDRIIWPMLRSAASKKADEYGLDRYIAQLVGVYAKT